MKTTTKTTTRPAIKRARKAKVKAPTTPRETVLALVKSGLLSAADAEKWLEENPTPGVLEEELTPLAIRKLGVGMYRDSRNLYLQVRRTKALNIARSWIFRTKGQDGKDQWLGLGATHTVTPQEARAKAEVLRKQKQEGHDPRAYLAAARAPKVEAKLKTLREVSDLTRAVAAKAWRGTKQRQAWDAGMKHVLPTLGDRPIRDIKVMDIVEVLRAPVGSPPEPLWAKHFVTAERIRRRLAKVFEHAEASDLVPKGENPARDASAKLNALVMDHAHKPAAAHHPAVQQHELAQAYGQLCEMPGIGALAMRFQIVTGLRAGSVLQAEQGEIDEQRRVWTVPVHHLKKRLKQEQKPHRVPLSDEAMRILELAREHQVEGDPRIFATNDRNVLVKVMRALRKPDGGDFLDEGGEKASGHGWRASFREWAEVRAGYPAPLVRLASAQEPGRDAMDKAYQRSDMLEQRAPLMAAWAQRLTTAAMDSQDGKVVALKRRRA